MKTIGYLLFAGFFYIFRLFCPIKGKKVLAIMTHDSGSDSNVGRMVDFLQNKNDGYTFAYIKKSDKSQLRLSFFLSKPYHMATSEFILMDNAFLPMAYIKFNRKVRVIQLWHGTGTIKKFGQDVNTGRLKELEKKANSRITYLIVNSEKTRKQYAKVFGIGTEKVLICGLPRTDLFFDSEKKEERIQRFFNEYPELKGKKLILYAPTFRDAEKNNPKLALDTNLFCEKLPQEYILLLRLHPHIADIYKNNQVGSVPGVHQNRVISMSSYPDINTLLLVSDNLITDYSSVIFEYCLLGRPMIFYAYDLEQFSDKGRGFYEPYEEFVPGPVVQNTEDIITLIKSNHFDKTRINRFKEDYYQYMDGKSAERLYLQVFRRNS